MPGGEAGAAEEARVRRVGVRWLLAGNAATAAVQLGLAMALAKQLTEAAVGDFVLALSIWAPVLMAANMGLRPVVASDAEGEHPFGRYLRVRATALAVAFVLTTGACTWLVGSEGIVVVLLVGLSKVGESFSELSYGLQQRHAHERTVGVSLFIRGGVSISLAIVLLEATGTLEGACLALAVTNLGVALVFDLPRARALEARGGASASLHPRGAVLRIVRLGAPLGATAVLLSLTTNVPRYFIEAEVGRAALGVFGVLGYGVAAGALVMNALCNATARDLGASWIRRDLVRFRGVLRGFVLTTMGWAGLVVVVALVAGELVLGLMFGPSYAAASEVFVWMMVAGGVAYLGFAFQYTLTAVRSTSIQVVGVALELVVLTLACAWWVPQHGLLGGALALLCGAVAQALVLGGAVLRVLGRGAREVR